MKKVKIGELKNVTPPSILYSRVFPLGFVTLILIVPTSPASEHKISVVVILKSGAGVASTVIVVSAEQLLESTTNIS